MNAEADRLANAIERLQADDLMPPVKSVETAAGGIIRITVVGTLEPDVRARLTAVMGPNRWTLVEAPNDRGAGVSYRRRPGRE